MPEHDSSLAVLEAARIAGQPLNRDMLRTLRRFQEGG